MDAEFETLINPPQEIFEQAAHLESQTEDWAFQMADYKFWSENFDKFWFIATVEKGTLNLVACISLARWDAADGPLFTLALYYCVQKYRGMGLAKPIFEKAWDIIGKNNVHGFGEVSMSGKYARDYGMDKLADHIHMFSSLDCADIVIPESISNGYSTKVWTDVEYESLTSYDVKICPRDRKKIMNEWFQLADTFTRVVFDSSGNIVGYATIRLVTKNKLSCAPFYADNFEAAVVLLKDLLNMIPNWQTYANIGFFYPECNKDVLRLLETFARGEGLIFTCQAARSQFTKHFIASADGKVYAVSDGAHQFV